MSHPQTSILYENNPKYKCCCGRMSISTGAWIIATLNVLGLIVMLGVLVNSNPYVSSYFAIILILWVLEFITTICLIIALHTERPKFVKPQIFANGLYIGLEELLLLSVLVIAIANPEFFLQCISNDQHRQKIFFTNDDMASIHGVLPNVIAAIIMFLIVGMAINYWFMLTLMAYHIYLCDKLAFHNSALLHGHGHGYSIAMEPLLGGQPSDGTGIPTELPAYQKAVKSGMTAPPMAIAE